MERNVSVSCPQVMSEGFTMQGIYPGTISPHPVHIIPITNCIIRISAACCCGPPRERGQLGGDSLVRGIVR
jgi:hypothetical protein